MMTLATFDEKHTYFEVHIYLRANRALNRSYCDDFIRNGLEYTRRGQYGVVCLPRGW